jgi:hypothetical protein
LYFVKNTCDKPINNIKYKFTNTIDNLDNQYAMIKLYMAVQLSRKYVKYEKINNFNYKFTFYLYEGENLSEDNKYDYNVGLQHQYIKEINIYTNSDILVDHNNEPIIVKSDDIIDHILLKVFIKLCNIMKISIKDLNVNSLVAICRGGLLLKLNISKDVQLDTMTFAADEISQEDMSIMQKLDQCTWASDNIIKTLIGEEMKPFNCYAQMIYNLYKNDNLLGMSLSNSLLYIISDMSTEINGTLKIKFKNIFKYQEIELDFSNIIFGMNQIGLIIDLDDILI